MKKLSLENKTNYFDYISNYLDNLHVYDKDRRKSYYNDKLDAIQIDIISIITNQWNKQVFYKAFNRLDVTTLTKQGALPEERLAYYKLLSDMFLAYTGKNLSFHLLEKDDCLEVIFKVE